MKLTNLFDENDGSRAVSPVIGVILMVAITVILAAVIGTFVLGLGENVDSTPQATWDFDTTENDDGDIEQITITHSGGDSIEADRLNVTGASSTEIAFTDDTSYSPGDSITSGDQLIINNSSPDDIAGVNMDAEKGDVVRIVYTSEGGGSSSVIGTYELPADGKDA